MEYWRAKLQMFIFLSIFIFGVAYYDNHNNELIISKLRILKNHEAYII